MRRSCIDKSLFVDEEDFVLSLIRHERGEHVFLVLEKIDGSGNFVADKIELLVPEPGGKTAQIYRASLDLNRFADSAGSLCYHCWNISVKQEIDFNRLVNQEIEKGKNGKIPYVIFGKSPANDSFGRVLASEIKSGPDPAMSYSSSSSSSSSRCIPEAIITSHKYSTDVSTAVIGLFGRNKSTESSNHSLWVSHGLVEEVLREGHNCLTWVLDLLYRLGLQPPQAPADSWSRLVIARPSDVLPRK